MNPINATTTLPASTTANGTPTLSADPSDVAQFDALMAGGTTSTTTTGAPTTDDLRAQLEAGIRDQVMKDIVRANQKYLDKLKANLNGD